MTRTDDLFSGGPRAPGDPVDVLRLIRTPHIGVSTYYALLERFGGAAEALAELPRLSRRMSVDYVPPAPAEIRREMDRLTALDGRFVFHSDADYPALLEGIDAPPPVIATLGDVALTARPSVGIVGARNASAAGRRFARDLARDLAGEGVSVVSGFARGIDTAAHEGSLSGGTVAVLAGGVDHVYPPENAALHRAVTERGCLVSEMPMGLVPRARHFPQRNRLIAGLSEVVVVVEAAQRSGALITARLAAEAGREVLAVPGSPLDPRSRGANRLIRNGATLIESAEDVLEVLKAIPREARPAARPTGFREETGVPDPIDTTASDDPAAADPGAPRARILEVLSQTPMEQDDLARESGMPVAAVAAVLLELEIEGRLQRLGGQKVALT